MILPGHSQFLFPFILGIRADQKQDLLGDPPSWLAIFPWRQVRQDVLLHPGIAGGRAPSVRQASRIGLPAVVADHANRDQLDLAAGIVELMPIRLTPLQTKNLASKCSD